ncbi:hypothetical protein ABVK25_003529 [Lepraria finkii]|uniref:Uncharacterized protein n=1 Tax=Lepraria finkii TaxID=1340010 RepID=A0ABR4BDG4_9LECA
MLEHKGSTTPSRYRGKGAGGVSNHSLLPNPSTQTQTITPTKTASSLLDFLILCHKGKEVEPWTVFEITPEEIQTLWLMLERHKSLYDYVLGKLRFDWSPHTSQFTVRMPTSTHDIFTELVVQEVGSQLKNAACGNTDIAAVIDSVRSGQPQTSICTDMVPSTTDIPSTHQTPPLHVPILNIPPSLSKPHTHSNTKTWPGWLMITYAVPTETSVWYWDSISNTALGLRGHRSPAGDLD